MKKLLLIASISLPLSSYAADLPKRKEGLWKMTVSGSHSSNKREIQQCIDAATDAALMEFGNSMSGQAGAQCVAPTIRREGSKVIRHAECVVNKVKMTSDIITEGDYNSRYTMKSKIKYDPPVNLMTEVNTEVQAEWVGPCEAGQKPGDIMYGEGHKMNIEALQKRASAAMLPKPQASAQTGGATSVPPASPGTKKK